MIKKYERIRLPLATIVVTILVASLGVTGWFIRPQQVMDKASRSLKNTEALEVSEIDLDDVGGYRLKPSDGTKDVSIVFYPGARVPTKAYAPAGLKIARKGYEVFLVKMPLNFAILGWKKAEKLISSRENDRKWVMAGHSMGGAMAARFISKTDYPVSGLVLWASYPPEEARFSSTLDVLSITGDKDEIISEKKVERSRNQLPRTAEFVEIEGGNHSQFGWYGFQSGDGEATISRKRQTELIARLTTGFLDEL